MTVSNNSPQAIPGYHMLRVLGKGGMAEVYLAHQDSVDREVALKLMSRHLLSDPRFAERFLREARIAAKLQHRHVVSIFDVGVNGEQPYIAMEYLSGGPVMPVDNQALDSDLALRVVFEMALALDYAHSKGYIHRDVKPDNILLRDDGSCVLSDFGIARTVDSATMMTNAGSIVGTPYYMSPEQLRGKEVDGRADLYSLGVVFYQMLTGKVPYTASDSLAIGIMHMTAPMPRLPGIHAHLQPLLDRMLAKEAADRVQTGRELAVLVREAQLDERASQRGIRTEQQSAVPLAALPSTRKIARIEPQFDAASFNSAPTGEQGFNVTVQRPSAQPPANARDRREPSIPANVRGSAIANDRRVEPTLGRPKPVPRAEPAFGQMDPAMDQAAWRKPVPQRAPSRAVWPWIAATFILVGAGGAYLKREEIAALIAGQQANSDAAEIAALMTQAQSAEAAGRWFDDTKFDAISLYERAVQTAPENTDAKAGLARSLSGLLKQAQDLLSSEPTRSAAILARLARQHADDPRLTTLLARLGQARSSIPTPPAGVPEVPLEQQLQLALKLERAREWLGARGALARYTAVLRIDPNNAQASSGVAAGEAAAAELLKAVITSKDAAGIERIQREWESAQPESIARQVLMRQWRALQSDGDEQRANISEHLNQAKIALAAGQLTSPPGQSAADLFKAVLTLDPSNAVAREGLQKIVAALISQAEKAITASSFDMAERLIRQASERGASANTLRAINAKLEAKIASGRVATPPPVVLDNTENDPRRIQLLIDIDSAIAQNALLDPPGANAFDLLRQVQRLGPGSDIDTRKERLSVALKVQLGQSVENSDFENAANILSSLRSLGPDKALDGLRGQLLESVISDIHAKIGAGALDAAERRLSLLKQIDSRHPEIPELQLELVSARGTG